MKPIKPVSKHRIKALNDLNKVINKVIPAIESLLKNEPISVKVDGSLYKKNANKINEIFEKHKNSKNQQIWLTYSNYYIDVHFKTHYKNNPEQKFSSVSYVEDYQSIIVHNYSFSEGITSSTPTFSFYKRKYHSTSTIDYLTDQIKDKEKSINKLIDEVNDLRKKAPQYIETY